MSAQAQSPTGSMVRNNLANILTWIRIAAVPLFVLLFYLPVEGGRPAAAFVFAFAAVTDLLDGYVARRLEQTSAFGEFLDPVADKLAVGTALVLLVQSEPRMTLALIAAIIIGREITVSALREWMAILGARTTVAVSMIGKIKTTLQMVGITLMIWQAEVWGAEIYDWGFLCLLIAAGLTLWSMFVYVRAAWPFLAEGD